MKISKKILLTMLISVVTIFTSACSSSQQDNKQEQSNSKLSNEEIIKKFYENTNKQTSADTTAKMTFSTNVNGVAESIKMNLDSSAINEPFSMRLNMEMDINGVPRKMNIYFKDDYMYVKVPDQTNYWVKTKDEDLKKSINASSNLASSSEYLEAFKTMSNKTNVTEKDGKYEIVYQGDGSELQAIIDKYKSMADISNTDQVQVKYKNVYIKYIVNKDTLLAESADIDMTMSVNDNDHIIKGQFTFANVNQIKEINLPDEAKNALDADSLTTNLGTDSE